MNSVQIQKNYIRTRLKNERLNLTTPFRERAAIAIMGHAQTGQLLEQHESIAFYIPHRGELSCLPLLNHALSLGKKCYLPRVFPNKKRGMWFLPYTGPESIAKGAFNIMEPTAPTSEAIRPSDLDLIFMPLVAFDANGTRLGMGGGYYDSVLSSIPKAQRPTLNGLAYNFQKVPSLPHESWDVSLDSITTPNYFQQF